MPILDPLVLPPDLTLLPVADLPEPVRATLEFDEGDWALTRPRTRGGAKIVDPGSAELLREFRTPTTIADAVIRFSRRNGHAPEDTLDAAYPVLARLVASRLLVPPGSDEARRIEPWFAPGEAIGGFEVVRCVQVLEDTELYQARRDGRVAAVKTVRPGAAHARAQLGREAAVLRGLAGLPVPAVVDEGEVEGRPWLALEWIHGTGILSAAAELRDGRAPDRRQRLLELVLATLDAYAALHDRGALHGDVHPGNLLVDADGAVHLLDFGLAHAPWLPPAQAATIRGAVPQFFEPEYARASIERHRPPPVSEAGEQHALGALAYMLLTGRGYADFSTSNDELLRQIAEDPPLPFSRRGAVSWPGVEAALARALAKRPEERFPSVAAFAAALRAAAGERVAETAPAVHGPSPLDEAAREVLARLGRGGAPLRDGLETGPAASVKYGAAGIAYALLRVACARDDAALLATADLWAHRALRDAARPDAFVNPAVDVTEETVGRVTPFHTVAGVHLVRAVVSHALGDRPGADAALAEFVAASRQPCAGLDVTLGRGGTVLGCTLLAEHLGLARAETSALHALGDETLAGVWAQTHAFGPVGSGDGIDYLGAAHGWAGLLYVALRWARATGSAPPEGVRARLDELASTAEPAGRGARWRWTVTPQPGDPERNYMPGWCNGSAGYVPLWTLAHETFGDARYLEMAVLAGWNAWEEPKGLGSLCCGLAGRAYGLLNLYRHTGDDTWLGRAADLGRHAALNGGETAFPDSLYKGRVSLPVLAADLERADEAFMPFFEGPG
jgi:serine/threonine-protein kinase